MFVKNLNIEQQSVLLYLTMEVIKSDDNLHELQLQVMDILRQQMDTSVQSLEVDLDKLASIFPDNNSKCSALLELIAIAQADHEYHVNEKALIQRYAKYLNMDSKTVCTLEDWVSKQIALSQEIQEIII